jgi:hypothetical protein
MATRDDAAAARRAGLLATSALAGGALRGVAAAGLVAAFGAAPALAQCFSGDCGHVGHGSVRRYRDQR